MINTVNSPPPVLTPAPPGFSWRAPLQFISLLAGLIGIVIIFILVWPDRFWLHLVTVFLAVFYVLWGALTHSRTNTLTHRVFWEYVGVAVLGGVMLWVIV